MAGDVEFYGELKRETDMAFLVFDGQHEIWLPKSRVKIARKVNGDDYEFIVPYWLAKKEGVI